VLLFVLSRLRSSLCVTFTGSASDWCALQEALYKCIDTIQYNTIQYNTIQYNTIQYNKLQVKCRHSIRPRLYFRAAKTSTNNPEKMHFSFFACPLMATSGTGEEKTSLGGSCLGEPTSNERETTRRVRPTLENKISISNTSSSFPCFCIRRI